MKSIVVTHKGVELGKKVMSDEQGKECERGKSFNSKLHAAADVKERMTRAVCKAN